MAALGAVRPITDMSLFMAGRDEPDAVLGTGRISCHGQPSRSSIALTQPRRS